MGCSMNWIEMILIVLGLSLFEVISSIDNAIINGEVLSKMSARARRWFLIWGILIAVFLVRGILPFIIFWMGNPHLGFMEMITAAMSSDPKIIESVEASAPVLLVGG